MALQKLNTDVVHGVSSGNLDVDAIALDNRDVQSALGGAVAAGKILCSFPSGLCSPPDAQTLPLHAVTVCVLQFLACLLGWQGVTGLACLLH